jgi:folate-dependent phosphoribosylglycinamide formyltransferase PurN
MNITVFTGNQPRHLALVNRLSERFATVHAVLECTTLFPGQVPDFFRKSDIMREYFGHVQAAERAIFGDAAFTSPNVRTLSMKSGDLNMVERRQLAAALESDAYVVFGSSFIKGWLADFLVSNKAVNIHMGVSPYFRGSSCNFWALYDGRPELVGSTIHLLSKGLDSGPMLYHALPSFDEDDPFRFTMKAVDAAQKSLVDHLASGDLFDMEPVAQDRTHEVRYSRNADFTDDVAAEYLGRRLDARHLAHMLERSTPPELVRPTYC